MGTVLVQLNSIHIFKTCLFNNILRCRIETGSSGKRTEYNHAYASSAEFINAWSCNFAPPFIFMALFLIKHRDNFALICRNTFFPLVLKGVSLNLDFQPSKNSF